MLNRDTLSEMDHQEIDPPEKIVVTQSVYSIP
jgi:hypothetical protein